MDSIAIVGTGISGLHLALTLQRAGVETTVYAERTPDQLRAGRLSNLVCRFEHTRARERAFGSDHWPLPGFETSCVYVDIGGEVPSPSAAISGGPPASSTSASTWPACSRTTRSVVDGCSTGPPAPRTWSGLVTGSRWSSWPPAGPPATRCSLAIPPDALRGATTESVRRPVPGYRVPRAHRAHVRCVAGVGEVFQSPFWSFEGEVSGLLFSAVPGGPLERLAPIHYEDNPRRSADSPCAPEGARASDC